MPRVSVIIPTYNHRIFVVRSIESALAQTFDDLEVIVVNDGAMDGTADALLPLVESGRIRYIEQNNSGQAKARNRGFQEANGDFIAFLDDDDLWPSDKLKWQVDCLRERPAAVLAFGQVEPFTDEEAIGNPRRSYCEGEKPFAHETFAGSAYQQFRFRNWIVSPGQTLIRASTLRELGGFDPGLWGTDDYDLYIRLSHLGEFVYQPKLALYYRKHGANASKDCERMFQNMRNLHAKHWGESPRLSNARGWMASWWHLRKYAYERRFAEACALRGDGDTRGSRRSLFRAAQIYPLGVFRRSYLRCLFADGMGVCSR